MLKNAESKTSLVSGLFRSALRRDRGDATTAVDLSSLIEQELTPSSVSRHSRSTGLMFFILPSVLTEYLKHSADKRSIKKNNKCYPAKYCALCCIVLGAIYYVILKIPK
jgi:hypothetical protein